MTSSREFKAFEPDILLELLIVTWQEQVDFWNFWGVFHHLTPQIPVSVRPP